MNLLDDMQKALDDMPELKKMNGTMTKHVKLTNEVSHTIASKGLMDVSVIEQNIVCQPANKNEHFKVKPSQEVTHPRSPLCSPLSPRKSRGSRSSSWC